MRFLRSLVPCLVFLTAGTLAYGQSGGLNEPSLGPIVLIGVDFHAPNALRLLPFEPQLGLIIPIAAFFETHSYEPLPPAPPTDEEVTQRLPAFEAAAADDQWIPIRVIGHPMPASPNHLHFAHSTNLPLKRFRASFGRRRNLPPRIDRRGA